MTTLMSLLISCQTTAIENKVPNPYDENGNPLIVLIDEKTVQMPYSYWKQIVNYIIIEEEQK